MRISDGFGFPSTTYSPMRNSRGAHVRATADSLLKAARVLTPPVPVERLVSNHGLMVTQGNVPHGWGYFDPTAWAIRLSSDMFIETPANRNRRRFTLAHELGHCLLEHGEQSCWNLASLPEPTDPGDLDDFPNFEQEAHHFARELLLPRPWFLRDWKNDPDAERWERAYGVSRGTLLIVVMERHLLMTPRKRR
jgi:Zn-dependent peptidase ImmA (M78 family)